MPSKAGNWMVVAGGLGVLLALSVLPAAFSDHRDSNLWSLGASLFSFSMLTAACGVYIKARALQPASRAAATKEAATPSKRVRGGCELCGSETPVVHCKVHQLHLCGTCLARHYDFRSCAYVPTTRRSTHKGGKSMAAKGRGA
jgi:hypothetical protein